MDPQISGAGMFRDTGPCRALLCSVGVLWTAACAPPSLRNAHSLDAGKVAVELAGGINTTAVDAELLAQDGDYTVSSADELAEQLTGDVVVRVGLGYGVEVGASPFAAHVKYSALDERRHPDAPLSIALTAQGGVRYAGGGLLLSRQFGEGPVKLRPVANVWYQLHKMPLDWVMPDGTVVEDVETVNPGVTSDDNEGQLGSGMYATLYVEEVSIPLGIEVPIAVHDEWDLVPFAAYTVSIPTYESYSRLQCVDCFAGLAGMALQQRSQLWIGLKLQPPLRRDAYAEAPAPSEESP